MPEGPGGTCELQKFLISFLVWLYHENRTSRLPELPEPAVASLAWHVGSDLPVATVRHPPTPLSPDSSDSDGMELARVLLRAFGNGEQPCASLGPGP